VLVDIEEIAEIVAEPKADAFLARRPIALQDKRGEQRRWSVLDRQRVREAEVVLGDDVRIDQSHRDTP